MMQKTQWEKLKIRWKRYIPLCLPITLLWAVLTLILHLTVKTNPLWADAANRYYGTVVRVLTNFITGWLPFSLAEGLLLFSPVLLGLLILIAVRCSAKGLRAGIRYICVLLSVICVLYSLFVPSLGLGSDTSPLSDRLGLTEEAVSAEELRRRCGGPLTTPTHYAERWISRSAAHPPCRLRIMTRCARI